MVSFRLTDADVASLDALADRLEAKLGVKVNRTETLRYAVRALEKRLGARPKRAAKSSAPERKRPRLGRAPGDER